MNPLVISTLPHYLAIYPVVSVYKTYTSEYIHIILASSTLSIVYHIYEESNPFLTFLDYLVAFVWLAYDLKLSMDTKQWKQILFLNGLICTLNLSVTYTKNYVLFHSLWHLLSAAKCFYVSTLIKQIVDKREFSRRRPPV
jgi:hypothetical protein